MLISRLSLMLASSALLAGAAVAQTAAPAQASAAQQPAAAAPAAQPAAPAATAAGQPASAMTPAAGGDIIQVATSAGQFTTLLKAAEVTGLTPVLKQPGNMTVFAPTDAAFAALPAGELDRLMQPDNRQELQKLLLAHIVNTNVPSEKLKGSKGQVGPNGAGAQLNVDGSGDQVLVNNATIVRADVKASNGVIHVVDKVIMPEGAGASAPAAAAAGAPSMNSTDTPEEAPPAGATPPAPSR